MMNRPRSERRSLLFVVGRTLSALSLAVAFGLGAGCVGKSQTPASAPGTAGATMARCRHGVAPAIDGLIDDFEDGTNQVATMGERDGYWYASADALGTKITHPPEGFTPSDGGANGSAMAAHVTGHTVAAGDQAWGVEFGGNFLSSKGEFYDASRYAGLSFRAKAVGKGIKGVRVNVSDANTHPDGATCTKCYNHFRKDVNLTGEWKEYRVLFSELQQRPGWGDPRPESVTPSKLISVTFAVGGVDSDFDVWVDDVQFLECKK